MTPGSEAGVDGESSGGDRFGPLIGRSVVMRELFALLRRIASNDIPVLVRGETGTGKELVARAIHEASRRSRGPYVVVDCAALKDNLLESELFGHVRGAFTGAERNRKGAIESGEGGTVFLDEIGELPLDMQPKLLRVLEQRTIRRVGASEHRPIDVRFVAATHRDLDDLVARGLFREDLYFRLAVLPVRVPPLRERLDDVEPLARHLLGDRDRVSVLDAAFLAALASRPWRGNIRELRNVLDRACTFGPERAFPDASTPPPPMPPASQPVDDATPVAVPPALFALPHREFAERWTELGERRYLQRKLQESGGNVARVAREIELARTYTHKLIKKHGLGARPRRG